MRYDKKEYTDYLFLREKLAGVKFQIDLWNTPWSFNFDVYLRYRFKCIQKNILYEVRWYRDSIVLIGRFFLLSGGKNGII